jgi:hypothetical protein
VFNCVSAGVIVLALLVGISLRVVRLGSMPPAFAPDEACDGYDAYSLLTTGRDHHGNFLPLAIEGFGDYRMPLFDYSLVPLVAAFGLKAGVVRLGAALWGVVDLAALTILAGLMLGWPGAAAAALFGALSPWHLPFSRYGIGVITASTTTTLAMLCFFLWLRRRESLWLPLCGVFFGISLYSYAITKAFTPLLIGALMVLYWRDLKSERRRALLAAAIIMLFALPQVILLLHHTAEMQAEYQHLSLFSVLAAKHSVSFELTRLAANWLAYYTPSFLFLVGDRGDHWTMVHPPGFGQLLPEQAPLILLALTAIANRRLRKILVLLVAWLVFATLPAALTVPLGATYPEAREMPTPHVMFEYPVSPTLPTPSLLLSHPDSRHALLAMVPWILLSALGLAMLVEWTSRKAVLRWAAASLLLAGAIFHGARFVRYYFRDFPTIAAPYFQYGIEQALDEVDKLDDGTELIVTTWKINQPYIYVLFFKRYPPASFQKVPILGSKGLFGAVLGFDRYRFVDPKWAYSRLEHGIFVFSGTDDLPQSPAWSVRYPDGRVAYNVIVK